VHVAEKLRGSADDTHALFVGGCRHRVAVLEDVNLRGRRRHAFRHDLLAGERVDERALARVEFAHDDEQEELVELVDRCREGVLILARGAEAR